MIHKLVALVFTTVWLFGQSLANEVVTFKISEKHNLAPQVQSPNNLFKVEFDGAVNDSKYFFFYAASKGQLELEYSEIDGSDWDHICAGENAVTCIFNMTDMKGIIEKPAGFRFRARSVSNPDAEVTVGVYVGDYIVLQNMTRQTVLLKEITNINALVSFQSLSDAEKVRIQLKAHAKREFASIEAYLNFDKQEFPTPSEHEFQFAHMDSYRSGFVAYSGENVFCGYGRKCEYRLSIETDGISSFQFSVVQGLEREKVETEYRYVVLFHKFDKSEAEKSRIYILDVAEEKFKNKDIKISLISISGWPNLYVNPELVPEYSPMSIWKETGGASKSIVIPWEERSNGLHQISVVGVY